MTSIGQCRHGEFVLTDGCPRCIAERQTEELANQVKEKLAGEQEVIDHFQIVRVQYLSLSTGELSPREYSYYSMDRLQVGDIVTVPVRGTTTKAQVSAIDIPESEIAGFWGKVKTIPAGSVLGKLEGEDIVVAQTNLEVIDTKINLCDTCTLRNDYPICCSPDIEFGNGKGNDNIIKCSKHSVGPAAPCSIPLQAEITPEPETAIALRPGEDIEVHGFYEESVKLLEYAGARVIASLEDNKVANDDLSIMSKIKKAMLVKRKEYMEPLESQIEAIRGTYNYIMLPIQEAEKVTKTKMLAFQSEQKRIRDEQIAINRKRMEAAEAEMALKGELSESVNLVEVAPEPTKRVSTEMGTSGMRDNWKYEIIDVDALPRECTMPDHVMLNAIAKKHHDQKKVAGVRFYNEPIIATRAK